MRGLKSYVQSYKDGKTKRKHQVIMEEHIGRKLKNNEVIHHIDGDKRNNEISNLLLTTRNEHAKIHKAELDRSIPVAQYSIDGELIKIWKSAKTACQELGLNQGNVCKCCKGILKRSGGYVWKYADTKSI